MMSLVMLYILTTEGTHMVKCPVLGDILDHSESNISPQGLVQRANDSLALLG